MNSRNGDGFKPRSSLPRILNGNLDILDPPGRHLSVSLSTDMHPSPSRRRLKDTVEADSKAHLLRLSRRRWLAAYCPAYFQQCHPMLRAVALSRMQSNLKASFQFHKAPFFGQSVSTLQAHRLAHVGARTSLKRGPGGQSSQPAGQRVETNDDGCPRPPVGEVGHTVRDPMHSSGIGGRKIDLGFPKLLFLLAVVGESGG
ncbi:hypothetical protein HDK90DRAFT_92118 [Phyllosticta capitalensis]|uniref:Uncharacterized protein n=1 Tax=Phyllosticta capitalensis TaxID=121624 RepID=A0ABR1YBN1_9PEZI